MWIFHLLIICLCFFENCIGYSFEQNKSQLIVLENGLHVTIISDSHLPRASVALSVGAGTWDDPEMYEGMAHLVEHLLFCGTESFPQEMGFLRYVQERGGECRALTLREQSLYGFSIEQEYLQEGLARFSQLFKSPLFPAEAIDKEIRTIQHEYMGILASDTSVFFRMWELFIKTSNPAHLHRTCSCGSLDSLLGITRQDIIDWFRVHYHPSIMHLVVASSQELDSLAYTVRQFFSSIPAIGDAQSQQNKIYTPVSALSQKGKFFFIPSDRQERVLSLFWEIPRKLVDSQSFVLGEAQALLEQGCHIFQKYGLAKGLATDIYPKFWRIGKEHGLFRLDISLTKKGVEKKEEVISFCFDMLDFIRKQHSPLRKVVALPHIEEDGSVHNFQEAIGLAGRLLQERRGDPETEALELADFWQTLSPRECLYFMIAPFSELEPPLDAKDSIYFVDSILEEQMTLWEKEYLNSSFFQETSVVIKASDRDSVFLVNNAFAQMRWISSDIENDQVVVLLEIEDKIIKNSVKDRALYEVFIQMVNSSFLNEVSCNRKGLTFQLSLHRDKLSLLLAGTNILVRGAIEFLLTDLTQSVYNAESFSAAKKVVLDRYHTDSSPLMFAEKILSSYRSGKKYLMEEVYQQIEELSYPDYREFQSRCFKQMFLDTTIVSSGLSQLPYEVQESIDHHLSPYEALVEDKASGLSLEQGLVSIKCRTQHRGNALLFLMTAGEIEDRSLYELIASFLEGDFFQEFRTKQAIAYHMYVHAELVDHAVCYSFGIESSSYSSSELFEKVDKFVGEVVDRWSREDESVQRIQSILESRGKKLSKAEILEKIKKSFVLEQRGRLLIQIDGKK